MQVTFNPESWRSFAREDVVMPFPRPDITPPVTKMYFGTYPPLRTRILTFCHRGLFGAGLGRWPQGNLDYEEIERNPARNNMTGANPQSMLIE